MFQVQKQPPHKDHPPRKPTIRPGFAILLPLLLAGCGARERAASLDADLRQTGQQTRVCLDAVWTDRAYAPLTSRLAEYPKDTTPAQLADDSVLRDDERPVFSQMYSAATRCNQAQAEHAARTMPTIVLFLVQRQNIVDDAAVDLFQQRIAWGEFNQRRDAAYETALPKINAALLELKDWLPAPDNAELLQHQVAARAYMQYFEDQPIVNAMN
jgi:hypothetical protein